METTKIISFTLDADGRLQYSGIESYEIITALTTHARHVATLNQRRLTRTLYAIAASLWFAVLVGAIAQSTRPQILPHGYARTR